MDLYLVQKQWKLLELLNWSAARLCDGGINDARLNAEQLLAHVLSVNRIDLYLDFERPLTAEEIKHFVSLLQRRLEHEPLQYILGYAEFMSLRFRVSPDVLIPRPETEILVENTITRVNKVFGTESEVKCLDIGTGCGNIAISLAYYLKDLRVWAIDISEAALAVAKTNAELNGVANRINFLQLDATKNDFVRQIGHRFDVLVSNPPYISKAEYRTLPPEIQRFEPKIALDGGTDGLRFYRTLRHNITALLKQKSLALIEVGADQAKKVIEIFTNMFKVRTLQDLAGRERVIIISKV